MYTLNFGLRPLFFTALLFVFYSCDISGDQVQHEQLDPDTEVFNLAEVDDAPEPVGGMQEFYKNLIYPWDARRADIEGIIQLEVILDADGDLYDIQLLHEPDVDIAEVSMDTVMVTGYGQRYADADHEPVDSVTKQALEDAAKNAVEATSWHPGRKEGEPVKTSFNFPILFQLANP